MAKTNQKKQLKELQKKYQEYIEKQDYDNIIGAADDIIAILEPQDTPDTPKYYAKSLCLVPYVIKQAMALQAIIATAGAQRFLALPVLSEAKVFRLTWGKDLYDQYEQLQESLLSRKAAEKEQPEETVEDKEEEGEEEEECEECCEEDHEKKEDKSAEEPKPTEELKEEEAPIQSEEVKENNEEQNEEETEEEQPSVIETILEFFSYAREILVAQKLSVIKTENYKDLLINYHVSLARFFFLVREFDRCISSAKYALSLYFTRLVPTEVNDNVRFLYFMLAGAYYMLSDYESASSANSMGMDMAYEAERLLRRAIRDNAGDKKGLKEKRNELREKLNNVKMEGENFDTIAKYIEEGIKSQHQTELLENGEDIEISEEESSDDACSEGEYVQVPVEKLAVE